jgi:diguanylate cyclase (GGDEF)-like protein
MASERVPHLGEPACSGARATHRRTVWQLPPLLLCAVLLVDTGAAVLLAIGLLSRPLPTSAQLLAALALCLLGFAYTEMSVGVERERRRLDGAGHVDLNWVWTFAAVLVLPGAHAAVVATVLMLYLWARARRQWVPLHRELFRVATVVLACIATGGFLDLADPAANPAEHRLWALLVAIALYVAVNAGLIAAVIAVAIPCAAPLVLRGSRGEPLLALGMLCMGALAAILLTLNPVLVVLTLLPLHVVRRAVLVRPLEAAASTDGKTGLLNSATWAAEAERVLACTDGVERAAGVLVLDLDHFKAVNDTYGHIVGDRVLTAVAAALRRVVRAHDLVGRMGGEEFVVMPRRAAYGARSVELESVELEVVAERIRARVADLRIEVPAPDGVLTIADLSVSIGGAVATPDGSDLVALLQTADAALYAAKRAGRNTVRIEMASTPQPESVQFAGSAASTSAPD